VLCCAVLCCLLFLCLHAVYCTARQAAGRHGCWCPSRLLPLTVVLYTVGTVQELYCTRNVLYDLMYGYSSLLVSLWVDRNGA